MQPTVAVALIAASAALIAAFGAQAIAHYFTMRRERKLEQRRLYADVAAACLLHLREQQRFGHLAGQMDNLLKRIHEAHGPSSAPISDELLRRLEPRLSHLQGRQAVNDDALMQAGGDIADKSSKLLMMEENAEAVKRMNSVIVQVFRARTTEDQENAMDLVSNWLEHEAVRMGLKGVRRLQRVPTPDSSATPTAD